MFQSLFISSRKHPTLSELTERYQAALQAVLNLQEARTERLTSRAELAFNAISDNSFLKEFERADEVSIIRQCIAISEVEAEIKKLRTFATRVNFELNVLLNKLPRCEQAMIKNNLLCAEALSQAADRLTDEINTDPLHAADRQSEFPSITDLHDKHLTGTYVGQVMKFKQHAEPKASPRPAFED